AATPPPATPPPATPPPPPEAKHSDSKPAAPAVRSSDTPAPSKPSSKSGKKKHDDLFDSRK
ncbi:MAG TPA: hypothetical protein VFP84_35340, partial [Kofleriaceae bacterium]|nr:hypothetical protein [Kofleriaceae bacterium]